MLYNNNELNTAFRRFSALFFFSITLITFQSQVFADTDITKKTGEEYRNSGYEEQQKGNYGKALQYYTKALELGGEGAIILNDIGVIYETLGIDERAEEYYLRSIQIDHEYLPAYTNVAYLYKKIGDYPKAVAYFKERYMRAGRKDPWKEKIWKEIEEIDPQTQKKILEEQAKDLSDALVKKAQNDFTLRIVRANTHYEEGLKLSKDEAYGQAIIEFNRALELTPENPKFKEAKEKAELEVLKKQVMNRSQAAFKLLGEGQNQSAKEEYRKILTIIPDESVNESE